MEKLYFSVLKNGFGLLAGIYGMYTCEVACLSSIDLFLVDSGKCLGYILLNSDHFWLLEVYWRAGQNDLAGRRSETPELLH